MVVFPLSVRTRRRVQYKPCGIILAVEDAQVRVKFLLTRPWTKTKAPCAVQWVSWLSHTRTASGHVAEFSTRYEAM